MRHGGQILVDQLKIQGVERVFCVPGESFLAALDGLRDSGIDVVVCRQEGGAAMMAEAHGKLTGRPGVAFVTRGPGATNASSGVHVAMQDSTPMILFIGQVGRGERDREAFQEVDYRAMFAPLAKWAGQIDATERIPEYLSRAFHVAQAGRPGPVVLALPEDMLSADADVADAPPATVAQAGLSHDAVSAILARLAQAERPMVIVGGGAWSAQAGHALGDLAERLSAPVGAAFRRQDYLDNRHPCYAGDVGIAINPRLAQRVREADVLLALGPRLGEMTTSGYALLDIPAPKQALIHIHADPEEPGRVYRAAMAFTAAPAQAVVQLAQAAAHIDPPDRRALCAAAHAEALAWAEPQETPGALKLEQVVRWLSDTLPDDAIITNGAGNYAGWVSRYYRYRGWRGQVAPTSGSMGYGLPAAIAAKLAHPERCVVCFAGDGCFQMTSQEMATAAQTGAAVIVLVCDNGMYGTIRMHQERRYPGRVSATTLRNPDFAALARSCGGFGETVDSTDAFAPAFARARAAGVPALLHLRMDPRALSTRVAL